DDEAQGPVAGVMGDELDGVRGQAMIVSAPSQPEERREAEDENQYLARALPHRLVILHQIHAAIKTRNLIAITVEHQRVASSEFTETALFGLAPAGVVAFRIHIGIKPVLISADQVPRAG